jgi:VWFA-related protein
MRAAIPIYLAALPLLAQTTGQDRVIRVTVDLVQLDAVVTDSQGRRVTGLKPEDFRILEDGKPQKITHFSYVAGTAIAGGPAPRKNPGRAPEAIPPPARALRPEEVRRTIVLMADDLGLSADEIPNVKKAMKSFVDGQMQAGDLVSIMTTSGGTGAMQQLTNDKRQLLALIDRIHYVLGRSGLTWSSAPGGGAVSDARLKPVRDQILFDGTFGAVAYALQGLHDMPGRKAIALFSDGAALTAGGIVELANRASVVLYTFDARGLVSFFLTAFDKCAHCAARGQPAKIRAMEAQRQAGFYGSQVSLDQMARGTGGIFFHDDNDLGKGLANAIEDLGSYYLIAYQPRRSDFDTVGGRPKFHKIEMKVLRPHLQVRSRSGFLGTPDPAPAAEPAAGHKLAGPGSEREGLRKALFSPFQANGFPVQLSAFYSASTVKDPKTGRRPALLRAMLAMDARALKFNDTPEGGKQLDLVIVAVAYGANNEVVASSDKTFSAAVTPDEMNQLIASGLVYNLEVEIPKPGPYQLRVAAWDANAERAGSASTFVEIPDFNQAGMTLSSVQLYDSDAKGNEELARTGVLGAGSAVTRVFASGATLQYDCMVYGALLDGQTGKPKLDVAVNLFRGPEQIYTGQPIALAIADGNSTAAVHAAGEIKLPATLPPGDYALELVVNDRLEEKQSQGVAQWVDFTLGK